MVVVQSLSRKIVVSPEGRQKRCLRRDFCRPSGARKDSISFTSSNPGLKPWATIGRPSGAARRRSGSPLSVKRSLGGWEIRRTDVCRTHRTAPCPPSGRGPWVSRVVSPRSHVLAQAIPGQIARPRQACRNEQGRSRPPADGPRGPIASRARNGDVASLRDRPPSIRAAACSVPCAVTGQPSAMTMATQTATAVSRIAITTRPRLGSWLLPKWSRSTRSSALAGGGGVLSRSSGAVLGDVAIELDQLGPVTVLGISRPIRCRRPRGSSGAIRSAVAGGAEVAAGLAEPGAEVGCEPLSSAIRAVSIRDQSSGARPGSFPGDGAGRGFPRASLIPLRPGPGGLRSG